MVQWNNFNFITRNIARSLNESPTAFCNRTYIFDMYWVIDEKQSQFEGYNGNFVNQFYQNQFDSKRTNITWIEYLKT